MNINATIFGQIISFVLFVLFCMKYIWPPLISVIEERQRKIASGLAFAEQAKKDLDIARIESINIIKKAKLEAKEIIDQAKKHSIQIIEEAKDKAKCESIEIISQAKFEINVERKLLSEELSRKTSAIAIAIAEKIIECSIDESTHKDIIDKIISKLE